MRISDWSSDVCSSDLPAEPGKALPDLRIVDAEFERDPDRGERVLDVVAPRHRQLDPVDRAYIAVAVAHRDIETVRTAFGGHVDPARSEEHTSELQSLMRISYAVFCLKKKK